MAATLLRNAEVFAPEPLGVRHVRGTFEEIQ
jgi:hypothetical protein